MISTINKVIDKPIRMVSALTVRSDPLLSLSKKTKAENRLPIMIMSISTVAILISMICVLDKVGSLWAVSEKMQIPLGTSYVLTIRPVVLLIMAISIFTCVKLGLWQWHKAEQKQAMTEAQTRGQTLVESIEFKRLNDHDYVSQMHMHTVQLTGRYMAERTFFLDNQVENGQAGFHVLTPLLLQDNKTILLVDRGWVPGFADHQKLPEVKTSVGEQTVKGWFWQQKKTGFRLDQAGQDWLPVQQVIDFDYLRKQWRSPLPPALLKLDPSQPSDGFVRHWTLPAGQVEKNLSYAYQWFGFAFASLLIGSYQMLGKRERA